MVFSGAQYLTAAVGGDPSSCSIFDLVNLPNAQTDLFGGSDGSKVEQYFTIAGKVYGTATIFQCSAFPTGSWFLLELHLDGSSIEFGPSGRSVPEPATVLGFPLSWARTPGLRTSCWGRERRWSLPSRLWASLTGRCSDRTWPALARLDRLWASWAEVCLPGSTGAKLMVCSLWSPSGEPPAFWSPAARFGLRALWSNRRFGMELALV